MIVNMYAPYKVLSLSKKQNEPLGLTVEQDSNGNLIVARILAGSAIEKQGNLHPGDVILEVDGQNVSSPEDLATLVTVNKETLSLRIAPKVETDSSMKGDRHYVKAMFNYDPATDSLLPCPEIGLRFSIGDILQVVDQKDPIWWQAKKVNENHIGLIPSADLEERRKAYVPPEADYVHKIGLCGARRAKKKLKKMYQSKWNEEFDKAELVLYEEVAKAFSFKRRTVALVGPLGVGRRTLKRRLINSNPDKYAAVIPHTSRPRRELEENGQNYWFLSQEEMELQIRQHKFLEYGEYNGYLYGTSLDSIRHVINQGKICVLDCTAPALKILHYSSEFTPFVIFVAAPGMEHLKSMYDCGRNNGNSTHTLAFDRQSSIRFSSRRAKTLESLASLYNEDDLKKTLEESATLQRLYEKYVDLSVVNNDYDETFVTVYDTLESLEKPQWVPVTWIY